MAKGFPTSDFPVETPVPTRAGVLKVSLPMLGHFLELVPGEHKIAGYNFTENGICEIIIEGPDMPERKEDGSAVSVSLLSRQEMQTSGERKVFAHWDHLPAKEWPLK